MPVSIRATTAAARGIAAGLAALALVPVGLVAGLGAQAQELTRLYAPKPPAGSAYVRVIDLSRSGAPIALGSGPAVPVGQGDTATIYRVVKGGARLSVSIDGRPVAGELVPAADAFSTVVVPAGGPAVVIADSTEGRNDLKAQLRFYNLVPDCDGAVTVADGGPTVFEAVAPNATRQRAINPIAAILAATCGAAASGPLTLPSLKAGDHYSLFLLPGASGPVLTGQRDETEPYRGAGN
ncbi:alginate O-acetyltransferase AlgF [Xanthobacter autotrophicus]|uniref:alginate O-acetyltransferase AlgF n=1 Tax=Xanthobacter autotrophicus TaxID=280 RepID=UPI0037293EEF